MVNHSFHRVGGIEIDLISNEILFDFRTSNIRIYGLHNHQIRLNMGYKERFCRANDYWGRESCEGRAMSYEWEEVSHKATKVTTKQS